MEEGFYEAEVVACEADCALALCESAVEMHGRRYEPDGGTGYVQFHLSFGFPNTSWYGEGIYPAVIAGAAGSMINKPLNIGHIMKEYDPVKNKRDRIIGSIVDVDLVDGSGRSGLGGLGGRVHATAGKAEAIYVRALAALFKKAEGVSKIVGEHTTGKRKWAVSQEVIYDVRQSGFAVQRMDGEQKFGETPEDLWSAGYQYWPVEKAPESLMATRDWTALRMKERASDGSMVGRWAGPEEGQMRNVYFLLGGVKGPNLYTGAGLVMAGAEPRAGIEQMVADNAELAEASEAVVEFFKAASGR